MVKRTQISASVGRPREFELDEAVRKAMQVFWDRGYHDASLPDLLEGMELSRGSFYKALVDKRGVYLRALDAYIEDAVRSVGETLHSNPSPKAAIRDAFSQQVDQSSGTEGLRGCFVVFAAVEMLPDDKEVAPRISRLFRRLQDLYAAAIIRAQALGEIDPGLDERTLARFLVCQIQGMRVLAKAGADRAETRAMVALALKALG
ncbi:TetR family transcriptional regulator C-terminal domain-containing protein [Agrobacterium sp. SORGH_AS_0745]|uniref:TetR/AcrR family transcriptional regulator n=1 Tax=Agrobacterium sp. SORGH_AS_0745 TaxID=3041773 RepID=UPI002781D69C|nr:TetR/AcrR family transcriptional repressor of nem operon [Agrobacterium tumefaciens]MDQ1223802.1 TetR/AcrR family transcriptional repressor of nem operon [Agrobacterium sp. SORGH_AS_0745]